MNNPTNSELLWLLEQSRSRRLRTMREFAEEELVIPDGEFKGRKFRVDRQPFTGCLLDAWDSQAFYESFISGPSQSGKTFLAFICPAAYHLGELSESYIIGLPDMRMANNKWKVDLEPIFRASPFLERLLPSAGPGSRGGEVKDSITFNNGAMLKFMTAGGDDAAKAGFTARAVGVTEAARFSQVGETSVEADPLRQLRARQRSFDRHRRRLYVEGTVTNHDELPLTAKAQSTRSRLVVPCPHCEAWIAPGREDLHGWQDAQSEIEAAEKARFYCPSCGEAFSEEERTAANREVKLLHDGQTIDAQGRISGEPPETTRLWFHWQAFHNLFVRTGDFGAEEWLAAQLEEDSADRENAEKMLCQFVHSIPYQPQNLEDLPLEASSVRKRSVDDFARGVVPGDTEYFTGFCDLGKWVSWYLLIAFRANKQLHIVDYGALDVCSDELDVEIALLKCLRELRDVTELGWASESGQRRMLDAIWVDRGNWKKVAHAFIRESNQKVWAPSLGRGTSQLAKYKYVHPKKKNNEVREIGDQWHVRRDHVERCSYVTFDADHFKKFVHARLATPAGEPGALTLFKSANENEHVKISKHFTNEQLKREFVPGKGMREFWHKTGANHLLDCAAGACAAGHRAGFRLIESSPETPVAPTGGWFKRQRQRREAGHGPGE